MYKKCILILVILSLFFICISSVSADDVNSTNTSDLNELSNEINLTDVNSTLNLDKDYRSTHDSQQIIISKPVTIDGRNHVIEAPDVKRVFLVKADNVCIKNINFINCNSTGLAGGVISWLGNNGTLINCNFTNNNASSAGGAVLWNGCNAVIENCNFKNNSVTYGPAASLTEGESFDPSQMHIMVVNSEGGALYLAGKDILVNNCYFEKNIALLNGGAISVNWASNVTISNSRFKNNSAKYGGGIYARTDNEIVVTDSTFKNNKAWHGGGGAIAAQSFTAGGSNLKITGGHFEGNSSTTIIDDKYAHTNEDLKKGAGGAVWAENLTVDGTTFKNNYSNDQAAAIFLNPGMEHRYTDFKTSITNCTFEGNKADHCGGAIRLFHIGDRNVIKNCKFTGNSSRGSDVFVQYGHGIGDKFFKDWGNTTDANNNSTVVVYK